MSKVLKKTILIVEDEAILAMTEKQQLENYGYTVRIVTTGEQAVESAKSMPEIDLVLMDINLGDGIDGTQAAEMILKDHDIPIVFLSSHSEREVVEKTEKITSYGYVVKNSSITVLVASIKMAFKLFDEKEKYKEVSGKLEATFEALPDLIFEIGLDGYFYQSHSIHDDFFDKPLVELLGNRISDVLPSDISDTIMSAIAEAYENGISQGKQYEMEVPAGFRSFEIIVSRIAGFPARPHFILIFRDITERKKVEKALQESEVRMKNIVGSSPMGIHIYDLDEQNRLVFVGANQAADSILGINNSLLFGKTIQEAFPSLSNTEVPERYINAALTGQQWRTERIDYVDNKINGAFEVVAFQTSKNKMAAYFFDITERKKAEEALQESKEQYKKLHESIRDGVVFVDMKGNITGSNSVFQSMLGYTDAELKSLNFRDITTKESVRFEEAFASKQLDEKGYTDPYEKEYQRKDGSILPVEISVIYLKNEKNIPFGMWGIVRNITERKKAEEGLASQRELYEQILEQSLAGYWDWDIPTGNEFLSPTFKKMFGYEDNEIENRAESWQKLIFDEDLPGVYEIFNQHVESNGRIPFYNEVRYHHRNGSTVWVICTGKVIEWDDEGKAKRMIGCHIDITDRKNMEVAFKESQERMRFALEGSQLGEWDWSLKTNIVKRNARWAEMLGYSLDEIENNLQQGINLQHPDDRETSMKTIKDHLEGKTEYYDVRYRMRAKDGQYRWIHDCGKIMERDEFGKPVRLSGTHADITDQMEKEERINKLLAEKELVLKEVHHRIKNNMNTINSLLTLQADSLSDPVAIRALEDAGNRISSMSILYDKLYRSADFTGLSCKEYISSLVDEVLSNFNNNQYVKVKKDLQEFKLDAKRLQPLGIIINELLTNIMKYAFKGRENGSILLTASKTSDHVVISVQDDGLGMPKSVGFENSAGFGLQLVQALTQQIGGTIRIERGVGTQVVLEFDV